MSTDPFYVDPTLRKDILKSYGRTKEMLEDDVNSIKEWMETQHHLPEIMEDSKIKNFLVLNGCSVEVAKQKIDMYYTIRSVIKEFFTDNNPKLQRCKDLEEAMCIGTHPKLIEGRYRVWFLKLKEPNKFDSHQVGKKFFNVEEVRLHEDLMVKDILIFDCTNFSLNDVNKITVSILSKFVAVYDKVYSLCFHKVYSVNSPSYMSKIMPILKMILPLNMFNRVELYQDDKVVKALFAKDELPKDFGGNGPSLQELNDMVDKKLDEYKMRFDILDNLKVNEALRPEKLKNDDILGYYGNFKDASILND